MLNFGVHKLNWLSTDDTQKWDQPTQFVFPPAHVRFPHRRQRIPRIDRCRWSAPAVPHTCATVAWPAFPFRRPSLRMAVPHACPGCSPATSAWAKAIFTSGHWWFSARWMEFSHRAPFAGCAVLRWRINLPSSSLPPFCPPPPPPPMPNSITANKHAANKHVIICLFE